MILTHIYDFFIGYLVPKLSGLETSTILRKIVIFGKIIIFRGVVEVLENTVNEYFQFLFFFAKKNNPALIGYGL